MKKACRCLSAPKYHRDDCQLSFKEEDSSNKKEIIKTLPWREEDSKPTLPAFPESTSTPD